MIQALTLDLIYLKLLIVHIQLMTLKSFEPWYVMHVLFENTRFSLCIIVTAAGRVFYVAVEARLRNSRKNTILFFFSCKPKNNRMD